MKKKYLALTAILIGMSLLVSCGSEVQRPEKWEIALTPPKGVDTNAKGTCVIDTKSGTDVSMAISGLTPGKVYTVYFVNVGSKMFEGIGVEPYLLPVDANGTANLQAKCKKGAYDRFTKIGVFMNPGKEPLLNPLGVDTTLGPLVQIKTPKMVLEGKLR
jgi:hypothetical protein